MRRTFMLAYQKCYGETGGGHGGEYRLYLANKKYHLMEDVYFIFADRVIEGTDECGLLAVMEKPQERSKLYKMIRNAASGSIRGLKKAREFERQKENEIEILHKLDRKYHFTSDDIYIFHDLQVAYPFVCTYDFPNTILISHAQGSLYNEWSAMSGSRSEVLRKYYNNVFCVTVKEMKYLGFPAKGAEESLLASEPDLKEIVQSKIRKYLNSGIDVPDVSGEIYCSIAKQLQEIKDYKFATVAALNEAKAVERIPQYLGNLKRQGIRFKWVLIGQGVKAGEVSENIKKYNIYDDTIWVNDYVPHDEILQILSTTDFYILLHKYSIFDLSTLEAMHYGNIPILSEVGGNKEIIIDNNGLFVRNSDDTSSFLSLISSGLYNDMKRKNIEIQMEYFNDKAFLQRYRDLIESF